MDRLSASQVVTVSADGTRSAWLGSIGHVAQLQYSYTMPGGPDQLSCTLQTGPELRTDAMDPGRTVKVYRGASCVWQGKLDEPQPGTGGWQLQAHGQGTLGTSFQAVYTTWNLNDVVNQAISRGLAWTNNPGITSGWLGQVQDSGSQTVTDFLNLICTQAQRTWYIDRSNALQVIPFPTAVNRLLVATTPVARTLNGDINSLWLRYQATADNTTTGAAATYGLANVTLPDSIAKHGPMESYADLSSAGVMSSGQAIANGQAVLSQYGRASFAGPFTVRYGQLLTASGAPVDLGCEQAGTVCRLMLTDFGYGGEVTAAPITFLVGSYQYDDVSQTAQITPYQSANTSISSILAAMFPSSSGGASTGKTSSGSYSGLIAGP